jgi:hypothetical protein
VLVAEGLLPEPSEVLGERFRAATAAALDALDLPAGVPDATDAAAEFVASSSGDLIAPDESEAPEAAARRRGRGGRAGRHSEDFDQLWSDLTATHRASPGATW